MFKVQAVYELLEITPFTSAKGNEYQVIKLKETTSDRYEKFCMPTDFDVSNVVGVRLVKATWRLTKAFGKPQYYFLEKLEPYSQQKKN